MMKLQIWRTDYRLPAFRNGGRMPGRHDYQTKPIYPFGNAGRVFGAGKIFQKRKCTGKCLKSGQEKGRYWF